MIEKNAEVKVLNHGYVKLIDWMGKDETIIEAARMSTDKGFVSWEPYEECSICGVTAWPEEPPLGKPVDHDHKMVLKPTGDAGLLEYLWKNHHATPFEMCELVIEVQAPIMVFREWHRHRTQSYNELSARYTQMPNLHYVPNPDRLIPKATKNKQAASVTSAVMTPDEAVAAVVELTMDQDHIYKLYEEHLKEGVPKEVARLNTPVSRYSKMRAKTDLRNWLAFLDLRMRPSAQWEIRQYADIVGNIISQLFPRTFFLFEEYSLYSETFSRSEYALLKQMAKAFEAAAPGALELLAKNPKTGSFTKPGRMLLEKLRKETA